MRTYAAAIYDGHPTSIPSTLKLVQGTMASNSPFPSNLVGAGCFGEIELANIGKYAIQMRSINMQLTAVPQKTSSYQYRMIDLCSLITTGCPPGAGGGGPTIYLFRLKAAPVGITFTPDTQDHYFTDNSNSNVLLNPNDVGILPIIIYFI